MEHVQTDIATPTASSQTVFFRVSNKSLKSKAIESISDIFTAYGAAQSAFHQDVRDRDVFYADLPPGVPDDDTKKIVNTLNKKPFVDEAWHIIRP